MAGKAVVRIEGQDATAAAWASATRSARQASDQISEFFSAAFLGIGIERIVDLGREAIKTGDELQKAAIKAGVTGQTISELAYAAKLADVDLNSLSTALKKMQVNLSEAATGVKAPIDALDALGLKIEDIKDLAPDKQFEVIGDRIAALKDPLDRARALTDLFGKAGSDLAPLFDQGAAGIERMRAQAIALNATLSDEQIKALADTDEQLKKLDATFHGVAARLTAEVVPALNSYFDALRKGETTSPLLRALFMDDPTTGGAGGRFGGRSEGDKRFGPLAAQAPGYKAGLSEADKAAEKQIDAFSKAADQMQDDFAKQVEGETQDRNEQWTQQMIDWQKFEDERLEAAKKTQEEITKMNDEEAAKSAAFFLDVFNGAFDAMEQNGKLSIKRLAQYILVELTQKAIATAVSKIFDAYGSGKGSGGGFWAGIGSAIAGAFGGGKAAGGSVSAGTSYLVGERGAELFTPGSGGFITPNHAMGGPSLTVVNHIDARGATVDAIKLLPTFGRQISEQTESRIIERLRTNFYRFGR